MHLILKISVTLCLEMAKHQGYNWKKVMTSKEVITELKRNGWMLDRIRGSHHIFLKNGIALTVPYHKSIKKGLLEDIKKQVTLADLTNN